jgi:ubiquinone/menaquinone biosynthesis C-methylase UbiE
MSSDEQPSLFFSGDARLGLTRQSLRRMALTARLGSGAKVLDLGCGNGGASLLLAREFSCTVVAADADSTALATLASRLRSESLQARVETLKIDFAQLTFADGEFNLVLAPGKGVYSFSDAAINLRRYLASRGRLVLCHPVRVGAQVPPALTQYWERKLGRLLQAPGELLQILAEAGYEPENIESLSEPELDEIYRGLEQKASKLPKDDEARADLSEQLQVQRAQTGPSSVTFACAMARRKEPGEKPPPARERG